MGKVWKQILGNEIIRFLFVGGCSTGIDFFLYMVISLKYSISLSKGISMLVSSVFSYVLNKKFTFVDKEELNMRQVIKFYVVFGMNFWTNLSVNYLIYCYTGYKLIAFVFATLCGMTVNYLGQKYFVFRIIERVN